MYINGLSWCIYVYLCYWYYIRPELDIDFFFFFLGLDFQMFMCDESRTWVLSKSSNLP
jgi:hypothetical protein